MATFLLLLLPALALAKISIELSGEADSDLSKISLSFYGNEVDIISDQERNSFMLDADNLKIGVTNYFGRKPTDNFVRDPTPHGDLFKTYGWTPVMRSLYPKIGRIIWTNNEPIIIQQKIFKNKKTVAGTYNVAIDQTLNNSFSSRWFKQEDLTVRDEEINFEVLLEAFNGGASKYLFYTTRWGETTEKTEETNVGSLTEINIELQPGQAVIAQLEASKATFKIYIEYEASLSGTIIANYEKHYKHHHFWSLDVAAVMNSAKLKNLVRSQQVIECSFYSNVSITVRDLDLKITYLERLF